MTYQCNFCNKPCKSKSGYTRHLQKCLLYQRSNKRQKMDTNKFKATSKFNKTNREENNHVNIQSFPSSIQCPQNSTKKRKNSKHSNNSYFDDDISTLSSDENEENEIDINENNSNHSSETNTSNSGLHNVPIYFNFYTELYHFFQTKNISVNFIDDVINIFKKLPSPHETIPALPKSKKFLELLSLEYPCTMPIIRTTMLESNLNAELISPRIITYDFKSQLLNLLSNKELFSDITKLSVNQTDIWSPYQRNDNYPFELQDGSIYQSMVKNSKENNHLQLGIQIYMDKTGTD